VLTLVARGHGDAWNYPWGVFATAAELAAREAR